MANTKRFMVERVKRTFVYDVVDTAATPNKRMVCCFTGADAVVEANVEAAKLNRLNAQ